MSTITFPNHETHRRGSLDTHEDQYYTPSFDTSAFQMNPHSAHPPRTPRTSMNASSSQTINASMYQSIREEDYEDEKAVDEKTEVQVDVEEVEIDEDEDKYRVAEKRVKKEEVWREMFLTSYGRDKAFKLIQYSIRVALVFHYNLTSSRLLRRPTRPPWEVDVIKRLTSTASGLSLTRKCLLLFNWFGPLTQIMEQQAVPFSLEGSKAAKQKGTKPFLHTLLHASPPVLLEFVNAISDDIATWSKLGFLGKKLGERAGRFSDWCWLLSTLVALVENGVERQMIGSLQTEVEGRLYTESMSGATAKSKAKTSKIDEKELARLQKQDYWLQVSRTKLFMDLIFVSYEVFDLKRGRDTVKALAGLASAIFSSAKYYDRNKSTLIKKLISTS